MTRTSVLQGLDDLTLDAARRRADDPAGPVDRVGESFSAGVRERDAAGEERALERADEGLPRDRGCLVGHPEPVLEAALERARAGDVEERGCDRTERVRRAR